MTATAAAKNRRCATSSTSSQAFMKSLLMDAPAHTSSRIGIKKSFAIRRVVLPTARVSRASILEQSKLCSFSITVWWSMDK